MSRNKFDLYGGQYNFPSDFTNSSNMKLQLILTSSYCFTNTSLFQCWVWYETASMVLGQVECFVDRNQNTSKQRFLLKQSEDHGKKPRLLLMNFKLLPFRYILWVSEPKNE
jgi:hypothetical protein